LQPIPHTHARVLYARGINVFSWSLNAHELVVGGGCCRLVLIAGISLWSNLSIYAVCPVCQASV
jgi:hypothetical protein